MADATNNSLNANKAKEEVVKYQKELIKWDGPANAARFLMGLLRVTIMLYFADMFLKYIFH